MKRDSDKWKPRLARRVWVSLSFLAVLTAVALPSALATTQSALTLPALKLKGNVASGRKVFIGRGDCYGCHELKASPKPLDGYVIGPDLDKLKPSFALVVKTVTLGKGGYSGMPAFSKMKGASPFLQTVLTNQQIADVAKYVSTVAGR
jgi:mono/diheme cytochrome c family protein